MSTDDAIRYKFERPCESERVRVAAWLEQHGIDPNDVPDDGWVELQPQRCRIAFQSYAFESRADGERRIKLAEGKLDAERTERYVQLDSPPLPFPSDITAATRA